VGAYSLKALSTRHFSPRHVGSRKQRNADNTWVVNVVMVRNSCAGNLSGDCRGERTSRRARLRRTKAGAKQIFLDRRKADVRRPCRRES